MGGTKFMALFHSLDKRELSAFGKYLRTVHANKKIILQLFGYLAKSHPVHGSRKAKEENWLAEVLFSVGPGEAALKQLHNTYHDLYLCLRDFLFLQKANDGSTESEWLWLSVMRQRDQIGYAKAADKFYSTITSAPKQDTKDHLLDVAARYYAYSDQGEPNFTKLRQLSQSLEEVYAVCRNKIDCELMNWQHQKGEKAKSERTPENSGKAVLPTIYQRIRQLLESNDDQLFREVLHELHRLSDNIANMELKAIWTHLKNHCAVQLRNGKKEFLAYAHELDKFASDQLFFLKEEEHLTALQFLNVVAAALATGELAWARDFSKQRLVLLDGAAQREVSIMAEAMILFKEGEFLEARNVLKDFDETWSNDESIAIRRRSYILMCMYESGEEPEEMDRALNSFYRFLQRSRSPRQASVKGARHFLLFLNHLSTRKKPKNKLEERIKAANPCAFKNWLLMKIKDYSPVA